MKIYVDGNERELEWYEDGSDTVPDILGNHDAIKWVDGEPTMSEEDFEWWDEYLDTSHKDSDRFYELRDASDDPELADDILIDEVGSIDDLNDEHEAYQRVFKRIEEGK